MKNKFTKPNRKLPLKRKIIGIKTISEMFEIKAKRYADLNCFTHLKKDKDITYTYSQVFELVTKTAAYLNAQGIKKGDHVAIISENRPEWAISYFAILWIGAVAIPLDSRAGFDTIEHILSFSESKTVFLSNSYLTEIQKIKESLSSLNSLILMEDINNISAEHDNGISRLEVDEDDLSEILFTSGTTGNPKGVMLSHRNIMSNVEDIYSFLDINPGDRAFSILPIHHSYEKTGGLLSTFYSGISIYYGRGLKPRELLEDLQKIKPTIWINTPLLLEKLISRVNRELSSQKGFKKFVLNIIPKTIIARSIKKKLGLDQIRLLVSGGAALPDWVFEGFQNLGITVIEGYGMSETSPLISANPVSGSKKGSVGLVINSDQVEIRDTDNDQNGEIVVKGPNVMKGYYKNEEETSLIMEQDNWLKTGDIGYFDADGYLYITGRKKFVIVTSGGKNVFPEEIEEKLTKSRLIEEALVFSPDDREIQAIVFPDIEEYRLIIDNYNADYKDKKLYDLISKEIKEINRNLEPYKRISKFSIKSEEFTKTTTRKIKRFLFKNIDLNDANTYL